MSKGKRMKTFLSVLLIAVIVAGVVVVVKLTDKKDYSEKYKNDIEYLGLGSIEYGREDTYAIYCDKYKDKAKPQGVEVNVDLTAYDRLTSVNTQLLTSYEGSSNVIYQDEKGYTEFSVNVPQEGMYRIYMEYFPVSAHGVNIERKLLVNNVTREEESPFAGADGLTFLRTWTNRDEVKEDNRGNQRKPVQIEAPTWSKTFFKDCTGFVAEPYMFYLKQGVNKISIDYVNEPIAIRCLKVLSVTDDLTYEQYIAGVPANEGQTDFVLKIQGEDSTYRSAKSLAASSDHSSPSTEPYSVTSEKLNYIGGTQWRLAGQWIEWSFDIPADGKYNITFKARQNANRGAVSYREVTIDGEVLFDKMRAVAFPFSSDWENVTLSDDKGTPYDFYLTAGTHTIRMEVVLGEAGEILSRLQDSTVRLNEMYRQILVLTGPTPDTNRTYHFDTAFREIVGTILDENGNPVLNESGAKAGKPINNAMQLEYKRLYKAADDYVAFTGDTPSSISPIRSLAQRLEKFTKKPSKIGKEFGTFKSDISSVGTSINTMAEGQLDIDYIVITGKNAKPAKVKGGFLAKLGHEVRSFFASFTVDYNNLGDVSTDGKALTVWITSGRDQSNVLKALIDDEFTPKTGIPVNLKVVNAGVVLNAQLAKTGPDVAVTMQQGDAVNYALRNAVEDLTQFSDYQSVISEYKASALAPYWYDDGKHVGLYGIPQTQIYNVLFYRQDILNKVGVSVPNTWDDLIALLPTLQQQNLQVAIPSTERKFGANAITATPDLSAFVAMLYQNGGTLYNPTNTRTMIDSENGVKAFGLYTRFYTHYGLSLAYDFANRFRSGEMPLGVQDYDTYNNLVLLAPEIKGRWSFTLMPGTEKEDGSIDRSCSCWGTCTMLLKKEKRSEKELKNAWEFMKWWVSADVQAKFGNELEAVLGTAARYQTANVNSFNEIPWTTDQRAVLTKAREYAIECPEIAGGYFITRHITNACRRVFNAHEDPRETLLDYAETINEEIEKKRKEYGLPMEE